jgi:phosphomannomutase
MTNKYIFDVDGTLTPSRQRIDKEFAVWFSKFCDTHAVYLVTGSDRPKTIEQVGEYIYHQCKRVYNCSGNDVWERDVNVRTSDWVLPNDVRIWLTETLHNSVFALRTGLHFENRSGMCNFSVVGRNATLGERKYYYKWDCEHLEREKIAFELERLFPTFSATVGGETGIDIYPLGLDKSQILSDFMDTDQLLFVGDKCAEGGNDHTIAKAIAARSNGKNSFAFGPGKFYNVNGWEDTWGILKTNLTS